jgi:hypothetical protein
MGLLERMTAAGGARPVVMATLLSCIGLTAPCNRASAPGPRPVAREHRPPPRYAQAREETRAR